MKADVVYIAETLKTQDPEVTCIVRNNNANAVFLAQEYTGSEDNYDNLTIYIINSSKLPKEKPIALPSQILCIRDSEIPSWIFEDMEANIIITNTSVEESLINHIILEVRKVQRKFNQTTDLLVEAYQRGRGLQAIADICANTINNRVIFLNTAWKILAVSNYQTDLYPSSPKVSDYIEDDIINKIENGGWYEKLRNNGHFVIIPSEFKDEMHDCICLNYIRISGVVCGYLLAYAKLDEVEDYYEELFHIFARYSSLEYQRKEAERHIPNSEYESSFIDLLEGKITDKTILFQRVSFLGKRSKKFLRIIVVKKNSKDYSPVISSVEQKEINNLFPFSNSVLYAGDLVILASSNTNETNIEEEQIKLLEEKLYADHIAVGVSNVFTDLSEMSTYYHQALKALEIGGRLAAQNNIYYYDNYVTYHMIELCSQHANLRTLCHPEVIHLWESPSISDQELLQTLYLYLLYMKDINRVTNALHIHRSTLFYRLNKIKLLFNSDLDDGELIARILFSFKIIEYMNLPVNEDDKK